MLFPGWIGVGANARAGKLSAKVRNTKGILNRIQETPEKLSLFKLLDSLCLIFLSESKPESFWLGLSPELR
ncbi:hypothetical protein COW36_21870 [bacterium (Candidatus Blackallbacteria) CG17_big_fil_post_rev_8_21_14_2_50_48_46]|uniref:Uncharacterized protein n=1 Tax=bacterium (Candidatus Blackallbacteria) CG17_big_fil_post_rev_8_21_14_2_50_48_46 TaxID=2014261 RepID=A0A2M7FZT1_9BACT|nr:MAG: hypothetical protein COW36_21870 [bacterium (Candidatus Blackallbacteria) CG17_big_fil_post_rev_8_21_14_2_50_48_46]